MDSKHQFALYVPTLAADLKGADVGASVVLHDGHLVRRISSVLRLQPGDTITLFDQSVHMICVLLSVNKKNLKVTLQVKKNNAQLMPSITLLLPLLKKDALEAAIYSAVELGVNEIRLVQTEKAQRSWGGAKEFKRLQRIMIAAAEQSKHFSFPELQVPEKLIPLLEDTKKISAKIFFDPTGAPMLDVVQSLKEKKIEHMLLMVGPEGDLSAEEKASLKNSAFTFCALTPTILRARQAVAVGLGALRSMLC